MQILKTILKNSKLKIQVKVKRKIQFKIRENSIQELTN